MRLIMISNSINPKNKGREIEIHSALLGLKKSKTDLEKIILASTGWSNPLPDSSIIMKCIRHIVETQKYLDEYLMDINDNV